MTSPANTSGSDRETGTVERLVEIAAKSALYTCALCEAGGNYETMCHPIDDVVIIGGKVVCDSCADECVDEIDKGATVSKLPDILSELTRLKARADELERDNASLKLSQSAWEDSARINKARADAAEAERDKLKKREAEWASAASYGDGSPMFTPARLIESTTALLAGRDADRAKLATAMEALERIVNPGTYATVPAKEIASEALRSITEGADHERS